MGDLLREFLNEVTADRGGFLVELVQSLMLLGIIGWAGRRTARKRMAARHARIVAQLAEAEQAEREAGRLLLEAEARSARTREEAPELLRQAESLALKEREAASARIEAEAAEVIAQARQAVARDKARVASEGASRLLELTAEATRRYLDERLTESERRALTQRAILASLEELNGSGSHGVGAG